MANESNLKPWKPGQSGNPNGKPKGTLSFPNIIKKILDGEITIKDAEGERRITKKEAIVIRMVKEALEGNLKAASELIDRVEGKPTQKQEITGADGGSIGIVSTSIPATDELLERILSGKKDSDG